MNDICNCLVPPNFLLAVDSNLKVLDGKLSITIYYWFDWFDWFTLYGTTIYLSAFRLQNSKIVKMLNGIVLANGEMAKPLQGNPTICCRLFMLPVLFSLKVGANNKRALSAVEFSVCEMFLWIHFSETLDLSFAVGIGTPILHEANVQRTESPFGVLWERLLYQNSV